MARIRESVKLVRYFIETMEFREDSNKIVGMMAMAVMLGKMTEAEQQELSAKLDEKYFTLAQ